MHLKTIRVRRSRPSALAMALALMLTMLCVYLLSLSGGSKPADAASVQTGSAEIQLAGLETAFICEFRGKNQLEARVMAARCAEDGGAGLVLHWDGVYSVIREAVSPENAGEDALRRSAEGVTLKIEGPANRITAVSDAVGLLCSLATETGSLASALENGDTNGASIASLMEIYRSQGLRTLEGMAGDNNAAAIRLEEAVQAAMLRLDEAIADPSPGKIKMIHAAACAQWISLLDDFQALSKETV